MGIDLSRFKVVYGEKVLRALSLQEVVFSDDTEWDAIHKKPKFIEILVINEDGNIEALRDEAWMFQFIPSLEKEKMLLRDVKRLDSFYDELKKIHKEHFPDWRFGQWCSNFFGWLASEKKTDLFFPEEDKMIEYIREFAGIK